MGRGIGRGNTTETVLAFSLEFFFRLRCAFTAAVWRVLTGERWGAESLRGSDASSYSSSSSRWSIIPSGSCSSSGRRSLPLVAAVWRRFLGGGSVSAAVVTSSSDSGSNRLFLEPLLLFFVRFGGGGGVESFESIDMISGEGGVGIFAFLFLTLVAA